ncbi:MAG: hypothetical protein HYX78_10085 [Armatimonadetes bacterium]|nr:hypothetical protein [Armatimonadota bacterium]
MTRKIYHAALALAVMTLVMLHAQASAKPQKAQRKEDSIATSRRTADIAYRIAYIDLTANVATLGLDAQDQPVLGSEGKLTKRGGITNFIISRDGRQMAFVQHNGFKVMDLRSGSFRSVRIKGFESELRKGEMTLDIEEFSPTGRYIAGSMTNGVGGWPWNVFDLKTGYVVSEHSGDSWGGPSKPYVWAPSRD